MAELNSEQTGTDAAQPEPLKLDVPVYDYVEKGVGSDAPETRNDKGDDIK